MQSAAGWQAPAGDDSPAMIGAHCESGQLLARHAAEAAAGGFLAVITAGACGAVQAGTCNTRAPLPQVPARAAELASVRFA